MRRRTVRVRILSWVRRLGGVDGGVPTRFIFHAGNKCSTPARVQGMTSLSPSPRRSLAPVPRQRIHTGGCDAGDGGNGRSSPVCGCKALRKGAGPREEE